MKQSYLQSTVVAAVTAILVGAIMLIGFMFFAPDSSAKFAILNNSQVFTESKVGVDLIEATKEAQKTSDEESTKALQYLNESLQQLEGRKNYISEEEYNEELLEIGKKRQHFVEVQGKNREEFNATLQKYRATVFDKIVKLSKRLRADREYDYVLNAESLSGHDSDSDKHDITGEVIKRLNEEMPNLEFDFELQTVDLETLNLEEGEEE